MLLVQFGQFSLEIVVHQGDRQIRRTLHDANAKRAKRFAEFGRAVHIDRLNPNPATCEILLRGSGRQAKACPIAGHGAAGVVRCGNDVAALDQPLQGFGNLVGRKIPLQLADKFGKTHAAFADRGGEGTIEFAVKKELTVL